MCFLVGAAGSYAFEEFDRVRLAINAQLEFFPLEPVHKAALLVEDHDVRLDQVGVDADDVFWLLFRLPALLSESLRRERQQRNKEGYDDVLDEMFAHKHTSLTHHYSHHSISKRICCEALVFETRSMAVTCRKTISGNGPFSCRKCGGRYRPYRTGSASHAWLYWPR